MSLVNRITPVFETPLVQVAGGYGEELREASFTKRGASLIQKLKSRVVTDFFRAFFCKYRGKNTFKLENEGFHALIRILHSKSYSVFVNVQLWR